LSAWVAKTGRVAYDLVMLLLAAALVYAVVDLAGYAFAKKGGRR
jgi:hypothetical protein